MEAGVSGGRATDSGVTYIVFSDTGRPITEVAKEPGPNGKTADGWALKRKRSRTPRRAQRPRCASCARPKGAYVSPR